MVRPVLMAVDDEPVALRALEGELGKRYGADYEVVCSDTPEVGLRRLERLWQRFDPSDRRCDPYCPGVWVAGGMFWLRRNRLVGS